MKSRAIYPVFSAACGLVLFLGLVPSSAQQARLAVTTPPAEVPGTLVICGGGKLPDAVRDRFMDLAGGAKAKLVVIPTASAAADGPNAASSLEPWKKYKPATLTLLHTRDPKRADAAAFVKPLTAATAVWFGGGDQSKIMAAYRGTAVERELHKLLQRGGVIGGTSAGAAVMSKVMITGGNPKATVGTGFGFLTHFVVDQHFLKRKREQRLLGVLAAHPGLAGLGVDEETAVLVRGRAIGVLGNSVAVACLPASSRKPASQQTLKPGGKADLIALSRAAIARVSPPFPPDRAAVPNVPSGSLIIGGGGNLPDAVFLKFIELAGGPDARIVVIPTSMEDQQLQKEPGEAKRLKKHGAKNVVVLHTRSRAEADTAKFCAPLEGAKGVWFCGGRQWRFVDAYEGTRAYRLFHDVLKRGGVIGGSSAGASIQSEYMPRGDPLGNLNIIAEGYERGFGFLPGVAVDQHFFKRKRLADMTALMKVYPQLLGVGIDEGTALLVRGEVMDVLGVSKVAVYDRTRPVPKGQPDYQVLTAGARYNLRTRQTLPK